MDVHSLNALHSVGPIHKRATIAMADTLSALILIARTNGTITITSLFCSASNVNELFLLRGKDTYENTFTLCDADQDSTYEGDIYGRNFGCITFSGGPRQNSFTRIRTNTERAICAWGSTIYAPSSNYAAYQNTFTNCIFECETAIDLSDYQDEQGLSGMNATLASNGTQQKFSGNIFNHCTFVGKTSDDLLFFSAREAYNNTFMNTIFYSFENYAEGTSYPMGYAAYPNNSATPMVDVNGVAEGFSYYSCCFYGNGSFPSIAHMAGSGFQTGDPGFTDYVDYNIGVAGSCKDHGIGGETDDFDHDGIRDGSPDIGAQEYVP